MNVDSFTFDFPEPPPDPVYLLTLQVEQLTRELNVSRGLADGMQETFDAERLRWRRELDNANRLILDLTAKLSDQQIATRNACAALVESLRALSAVSDSVNVNGDGSMEVLNVLAFVLAVAEAREVIARHGIPF